MVKPELLEAVMQNESRLLSMKNPSNVVLKKLDEPVIVRKVKTTIRK